VQLYRIASLETYIAYLFFCILVYCVILEVKALTRKKV